MRGYWLTIRTVRSLACPRHSPAANDDEAVARAEAMRGVLAAELLDFDGLRIVNRLPPKQ
jgi:hypothetical protein